MPLKPISATAIGPLSGQSSAAASGPPKHEIRDKVLHMLDSCMSVLCACNLNLKKKKKEREKNWEVFLADHILFFCSLLLCFHLSTWHLYNLMPLSSGRVHNALPGRINSTHRQPRYNILRSPFLRTDAPGRSDDTLKRQRKLAWTALNKGQMHLFGNLLQCVCVSMNVCLLLFLTMVWIMFC